MTGKNRRFILIAGILDDCQGHYRSSVTITGAALVTDADSFAYLPTGQRKPATARCTLPLLALCANSPWPSSPGSDDSIRWNGPVCCVTLICRCCNQLIRSPFGLRLTYLRYSGHHRRWIASLGNAHCRALIKRDFLHSVARLTGDGAYSDTDFAFRRHFDHRPKPLVLNGIGWRVSC